MDGPGIAGALRFHFRDPCTHHPTVQASSFDPKDCPTACCPTLAFSLMWRRCTAFERCLPPPLGFSESGRGFGNEQARDDRGRVLFRGSLTPLTSAGALPVKALRPSRRRYNWTGCYVGAGGGYGMFNQETTSFARRASRLACRMTSAAAAGSARCRSAATIRSARTSSSAPSATMTSAASRAIWSTAQRHRRDLGEEKLKNSWAAGGRIGWVPFSTQLLVYVSGGYTQARFSAVTFVSAIGGAPTGVVIREAHLCRLVHRHRL